MIKAIVYIFLAVGFLYFLFYPFLKNAISRKRFMTWFLIIYAIAMLASTINTYFLD